MPRSTKERRPVTKTVDGNVAPRVDVNVTSRVAALESSMTKVLEGINMLAANFKEMRDHQNTLPMAQKPERILEAANLAVGRAAAANRGTIQTRARASNALNPRGALTRTFAINDVVRLAETSDLYARIKTGLAAQEHPVIIDEPPLGVVLRPLQITHAGSQKYRVHFDGIGEDGCLEEELELVKSAV